MQAWWEQQYGTRAEMGVFVNFEHKYLGKWRIVPHLLHTITWCKVILALHLNFNLQYCFVNQCYKTLWELLTVSYMTHDVVKLMHSSLTMYSPNDVGHSCNPRRQYCWHIPPLPHSLLVECSVPFKILKLASWLQNQHQSKHYVPQFWQLKTVWWQWQGWLGDTIRDGAQCAANFKSCI